MKNKRQEFIWIDLGACIYPTVQQCICYLVSFTIYMYVIFDPILFLFILIFFFHLHFFFSHFFDLLLFFPIDLVTCCLNSFISISSLNMYFVLFCPILLTLLQIFSNYGEKIVIDSLFVFSHNTSLIGCSVTSLTPQS